MITALVAFGAVDAGFVYNSDKVAAGTKVIKIKIDTHYQSYPLPTYPIAVVKANGAQGIRPVMAARFIAFALSARGQRSCGDGGSRPSRTRSSRVSRPRAAL